MNIVTEISEWQSLRKMLAGKTIGFVPTMGNLHAGHLSLCQQSQLANELTVVSIFVNPTQFNDPNDFDRYPGTHAQDVALLATQNIDYLLLPNAESLYPDHYEIKITESELSRELEGAYRLGHFDGMLTVVLKLLNLVYPENAYFGEKDYQQFLLIKKMVAALFLPINVVSCETVRAADGLALSSRNSRLTAEQRLQAVHFPSLLQSDLSQVQITEKLTNLGFVVDYIAEKWQRRLGAVRLGDVRLIDNTPRVY